ncbi:MAG: DNA-3-methyladenine glycosylase 2 family protein [Pseudonocardia sp.]|nr:DNA-3-methyladenine glycosylase 2 family protein [Pseudonocardia sp.]
MYTIFPKGPFSLAESTGFAYIDREPEGSGPSMRLAFCRDGSWEPTGVSLVQHDSTIAVDGDPADRAQVERILALDVDASGFADVGARDPVIGRLQAAAPGLRPPLLHSAYEAAVFCILTARRSAAQARRMRTSLAERAGTVLDVDGHRVTCLPPPAYLADPDPVSGLDPTRRERVQGVARAALDGKLDTAALRAMTPENARAHLELLSGIGPFSSAIIVTRALGHTDYLAGPITELNTRVGELYDLGHPATPDELERIAQAWSPWRTWSQLYIRSVSPRPPR